MASNLPVSPYCSKAFPAASASLNQFQFVQVTSTGTIQTPSATGVFCWVLNDAPSMIGLTVTNDFPQNGFVVGAYYTCLAVGLTGYKVISGESLAANTAIATGTDGKAYHNSGSGVTLGYTVAASNSGDIVQIVPA